MPPGPMAENAPLQITELRRLMQQCNADWDELTQSLQADKQRLTDARQHLENVRLLLAFAQEQPSGQMMALSVREAALERQVALLQQGIALKSARRDGVARQFDQTRLALVALRKAAPIKRRTFVVYARKLLNACIRRPLHAVWSTIYQPGERCEAISGGTPLWPHL